MAKTVWLTSLVRAEDEIRKLIAQMKSYGLEVKGHFWEDNIEKMAWMSAREELVKPDVALWLIMGANENLLSSSIRYGLSLLAVSLQAQRGLSFPIVFLLNQGTPLSSENLPTSLKGADFLLSSDAGMTAKLVAKVHTPPRPISSEYRLDVYGSPQIGQWFEIGPAEDTWPGAMFGVSGGEITFHAVGSKGSLPSQTVLHYPLKGLKLALGEKEFVAWAVQNEINTQTSYFLKVEGFPESIIFGPQAAQEEAEVYVVKII